MSVSQCEHYTGRLWGVIRRVKKSEAIYGIHVRVAAIPSETGDFVRWRVVTIEVNQYEKYDGFADTQALKVFPMSIARAPSQRHTEHGHPTRFLQSWTLLQARFPTETEELIHAHPPRDTEPDCIVVWLLFKAHSGARKAARLE